MDFKILFIYPNFRVEALIPSGVALLSAILKNNGFLVELFDSTDYGFGIKRDKDYDRVTEGHLGVRPSQHREPKNLDRNLWLDLNSQINKFCPDLIAMSCTESTFLFGVEIIQHIEGHNHDDIPVVLGGAFATYAHKRALGFQEIDIVCIGEGEKSLLELCKKIRNRENYKDVGGIAFRNKFGEIHVNKPSEGINLEENPIPDISIFDKGRIVRPMAGKLYMMAPVETVRGCPYICAFCNSRDSKVQKKPIQKIYEELLHYKKHSIEYMFFWADTFLTMSDKELDEFCEMYKGINLPFWIQTHVLTITERKIRKLKEVGLHRLSIGIENGDEQFRKKVLQKNFSNKQAIEGCGIVNDVGVPYNTNNMVGYVGETREIAMRTVELNKNFQNADINCFTFTPYYGTPARDQAVAAGFMYENAIAPGNVEDSILNMSQFTKEEIRGLKKTFALYVKFPKSRWSEIRQAEKDEKKFREFQKEFTEEFFKPHF